jgi:hypothetical protein
MTKQIAIAALTIGAFILGTNNAPSSKYYCNNNRKHYLNDVISIDAGSTAIGNTVDFNYVTAADYNRSNSN